MLLLAGWFIDVLFDDDEDENEDDDDEHVDVGESFDDEYIDTPLPQLPTLFALV